MSGAIRYQPEIDGLRAVAVVLILLFHLDIAPFSGGFVGVDVFFVISGYLITAIVLAETEAGRFGFLDFYARRMRRLLPALLATIAVTFVAGAILLAPQDLARAGASTAAAVLGLSNIHFWLESGYFDVDAIHKPLLHTWSLAVELQFYLVWPAFLVGLAALGRRRAVLWGATAATLAGTIGSVWILPVDAAAGFYLTPFRLGEFAAGALVASLGGWRPAWRLRDEILFVAGMGCILGAAVTLDDRTPFPGMAALLPVAGAALAIHAAPAARSARVLTLRPVVWVGLISYSLYLVHWPLIVFTHGMPGRPLDLDDRAKLLAASLLLAAASYRLIERPFRAGSFSRFGRGPAFAIIAPTLAAATFAAALHASLTGGWVWRFPADLQAINTIDLEAEKAGVWANFTKLADAKRFTTNRRHVLVLGDSQAGDLVNLLVSGGYGRKVEIVGRAIIDDCGLPSFSKFEQATDDFSSVFETKPDFVAPCRDQYAEILSTPLLQDADIIIIAKHWSPRNLAHVEDFVTDLRSRADNRIILAGPKMFASSSIDIVNIHGSPIGVDATGPAFISKQSRAASVFLKERYPDAYIDLLAAICPANIYCHVLTESMRPVYWDRAHFTAAGVEFLGRSYGNILFSFLDEVR